MAGPKSSRTRRLLAVSLLVFAGLFATCNFGYSQKLNKNEKEVKPAPNVQDVDDVSKEGSKVWVLDLVHQDPAIRQIMVDVPGKGRKVCWYMWYQIINYTNEPRSFNPKFELVRHDKNVVYVDQIL